MTTFNAAILEKSNTDLIVDQIEFNENLKAGQVLVKVFYSGICGAQINEIQAVTGAAKISKGRIKTEQSIAAARIDILELDAKLALGEEKGIKFTKDKLEQLRLQKVLKKEGIYASQQELKIAREELDLKNRINKVKVLNQGSAAVASPLNDAFFNSREKIKILDEEIADAQKDAIAAYFSGSEAEKLALDLRIATLGIERKLIEINNTQR